MSRLDHFTSSDICSWMLDPVSGWSWNVRNPAGPQATALSNIMEDDF